jgi:carboxymethylenebutenolidase
MAPMSDAIWAGPTTVTGHGGDTLDAYLARPLERDGVGAVVVVHHMPGFDEATKEIVRRLATLGYAAVAPNLHHREAPGARADDAAAAVRAAGGVPDERAIGDVAGAASYLRELPATNGAVGVIGFCSGGRQALLCATELDVQAVVNCYGAFVMVPPPSATRAAMIPVAERLGDLRCPVLGLFGEEDKNPTPAEVDALRAALDAAGKPYEFHTFPEAGHAFFAVDRPAYRPAAATEGWRLIADFLARHLES